MCTLGCPEVLEQREVEAMISRTLRLRRSATERSIIGLSNSGCHRGTREGVWVQPMVHVVGPGGHALARDKQRVAAKAGSGAIDASHSARLAVLERQYPVGTPAACQCIYDARAVSEKPPPMAHRQFVDSTQVEHFGDVKIAEPIISVDPKIWQKRRAVGECRFVEHIGCIGSAFGPGKIGEHAETTAETAFVVHLE
jgi:hypothetical protein